MGWLLVFAVLCSFSVNDTATPESEDCFSGTAIESAGLPAESDNSLHSGWPVDLNSPGAGFPYTPTLYDIDDDGACEIFLTGGETFGLSGDGSFLPGWPTEEMAYMGYASTGQLPGPSVGDMNGDGVSEVMWTERDWYAGSAHMWTFNGRSETGVNLSGYPQTAPDESSNALASPFVLGDADGDGQLEAFTAHTLGNTGDYYRLSCLDYSGNILFTTDLNTNEDILNTYFGDADGNGFEEFFAVTLFSGSFRLHLFNADGSYQAGYPTAIYTPGGGNLMFGPPISADLDKDGDLEIVLGYSVSSTAYAVAVNHDGSLVSGFPITVATGSQLFYLGMGDINGDGEPELLAADNELSSDYRMWAIEMSTGSPLSGWPVAVANWPKGFPAVADLDNDGVQDISFTTDGGQIHALSSNGTELSGFPKSMSAAATSGAAVGDIDGDGLYELVAATWDGWVYAWDTEGAVADNNRDWPMRGVDSHYTGIYRGSEQSGTGSVTQTVSLTLETNPVGSVAVFHIAGMEGPAEIDIYDISGKLITTVSSAWSPDAATANGVYLACIAGENAKAVKFLLAR